MGVILVTHDRYLLDRVSTTVLGLDGRGGTERFDHRLRDDGRDALTSDRQVSDDATARVRHRCPHSIALSGNVPNSFTHSSQCTTPGSGLPGHNSDVR